MDVSKVGFGGLKLYVKEIWFFICICVEFEILWMIN